VHLFAKSRVINAGVCVLYPMLYVKAERKMKYVALGAKALCILLVLLSTTAVGSAAGLPPNKTPYSVSGPEIRITAPPVHQAHLSSETLIASITSSPGYPTPDTNLKEYPHIILAIYEDGTLIWSDDHIRGGCPYHLTKLPTKLIQEFKKQFFLSGLFMVTQLYYSDMPDISFEDIYIRGPNGYMVMRSTREFFLEHDGREDRFHNEVESPGQESGKPSITYQEFNAKWSEVKRRLLGLIPAKGAEGITIVTIQPGIFSIKPTSVTGSSMETLKSLSLVVSDTQMTLDGQDIQFELLRQNRIYETWSICRVSED
jgi:hypothetical protein